MVATIRDRWRINLHAVDYVTKSARSPSKYLQPAAPLLYGELNVDDEGCRGDSTNNAASQGVSQPGGFEDVDLRELVTQLLTDFGHRGESGEFVEAGGTEEETQTEAANRGDKVVRVSVPT